MKIDNAKFKRQEDDVDRTSAEGKASSVQFIHFKFNDDLIVKFKSGIGIEYRIPKSSTHYKIN